MKKIFSLIALLSICFVACKKLDKLTQFEIDYTETVVIPASAGISLPFNFATPEKETNSESTFSVNETRKDLIEEIKLIDMTLTITSPSNADFSFLKSIEIFLNADGLSETKIAWLTSVPANAGNKIDLSKTSTDLKEYIKKDKMSLRVKTVTDETLGADHEISAYANFFVDAKVLGQ
jgi:hypothetical protein